MQIAALIGAYHESAEPDVGLRATLPLAGRTLIERQARLAADAGARPVIVVVETPPPELAQALERLREEGIDIFAARSALEAAKAVQSGDRILIMADGFLPDEALVERVIEGEGPLLLTVPDVRFDDRFERIDADSRWGGLALIDGQMLKHTAAMLQDWDLQSTLLRRAVQGGARFIAIADPADTGLIAATRSSDLANLETQILEGASAFQADWVSRYMLAPLEQFATRRLMPTGAGAGHARLASLLLTCLSAFAFSRSWLWAGLILFLFATPLDGIAERLARLRMSGVRPQNWVSSIAPPASGAALLALAYALAPLNGWGCYVLAATAVAFLLALAREGSPRAMTGGFFLAEPKGMAWLMLPFAATGQWVAGLGALAAYAAASFFWAQRQAHRLTG
jgi:hypothetical protein